MTGNRTRGSGQTRTRISNNYSVSGHQPSGNTAVAPERAVSVRRRSLVATDCDQLGPWVWDLRRSFSVLPLVGAWLAGLLAECAWWCPR